MVVRNLGELRNGRDVVFRVSDALDVDGFSLFVNGCGERLGFIVCHEIDADPELFQQNWKFLC